MCIHKRYAHSSCLACVAMLIPRATRDDSYRWDNISNVAQ